jgi:hypothetical protein
MRGRVVQWFLLLVLGVVFVGVSGCATNEPENASVRPWNTPQDWEYGLPINNLQHR